MKSKRVTLLAAVFMLSVCPALSAADEMTPEEFQKRRPEIYRKLARNHDPAKLKYSWTATANGMEIIQISGVKWPIYWRCWNPEIQSLDEGWYDADGNRHGIWFNNYRASKELRYWWHGESVSAEQYAVHQSELE